MASQSKAVELRIPSVLEGAIVRIAWIFVSILFEVAGESGGNFNLRGPVNSCELRYGKESL